MKQQLKTLLPTVHRVRADYVAMQYSLFGLSVNWKQWYIGFMIDRPARDSAAYLRLMLVKWHWCIWWER